MIISTGRRYIFVHIPKTGGTAMALALEDRAMADDVLIGDTPKAKRRKKRLDGVRTAGRLWKHSTLADAAGLISAQQMTDYFVFTLVRNPWDRLVSYYHWLGAQSFDHPAVGLAKSLDFSDFLRAPLNQTGLERGSYASYVTDAAGTDHCNAYIRLEHLAEDLAPVMEHLGFDLTLPRANESTRRADWRSYYSDADAEEVARICARDIATFNYRFDL